MQLIRLYAQRGFEFCLILLYGIRIFDPRHWNSNLYEVLQLSGKFVLIVVKVNKV